MLFKGMYQLAGAVHPAVGRLGNNKINGVVDRYDGFFKHHKSVCAHPGTGAVDQLVTRDDDVDDVSVCKVFRVPFQDLRGNSDSFIIVQDQVFVGDVGMVFVVLIEGFDSVRETRGVPWSGRSRHSGIS